MTTFVNFLRDASLVLAIITVFLLSHKIICFIFAYFPPKRFKPTQTKHKFGIIIPARDESKVIRWLLESIAQQTYDKQNLKTYVIVETEEDPTNEICKEFENVQIVIRNFSKGHGKGAAIAECFDTIIASGQDTFDGYFIFDADNVLSRNFIEKMNDAFDTGYDCLMGNRDSKNWNDNWISASSSIVFSIFNKFQNKFRTRVGANILFSGTGTLVRSDIIKQNGGWPFKTLTEDYEMTLYCTLHGKRTAYVDDAKFYDEAPTDFKTTWTQRLRWVKGFAQANKKYKKDMRKAIPHAKNKWSLIEHTFSIIPLVAMIVNVAVFFLGMVACGLIMGSSSLVLEGVYALAGFYLFFVLYTFLIITYEHKQARLSPLNFVLTLILNPLFMWSYVLIVFRAVFARDVKWLPIKHTKAKSLEEIENQRKKLRQPK